MSSNDASRLHVPKKLTDLCVVKKKKKTMKMFDEAHAVGSTKAPPGAHHALHLPLGVVDLGQQAPGVDDGLVEVQVAPVRGHETRGRRVADRTQRRAAAAREDGLYRGTNGAF